MAHKLLGMSYAAQEDFKLATVPFQAACGLNPAEENACYYVGRTLYVLSRFEEARAAFENALKPGSSRGKTLLGLA